MKKLSVIISVVILLGLLFYFFGVVKPKCSNDICFNQHLKKCSPVTYTRTQNNNLYKYTISRSLGSSCKLTLKNKKVAVTSDFDVKNLLEGKSMKCKIPKSDLSQLDLSNMKNLMTHCTGPLKEGMYELLLKRMYSLVVTQMSGIVREAEGILSSI